MAVTVVGAGSWGSGNSGGNPICTIPTVSGGILATDMLVVIVNAHKAAAQTESLPATHSTRAAMSLLASASGNTQGTATDTGPCLIGVYTETGASIAGDDGGSITTNIDGFTSGTSGTSAATRCLVLRRDDTGKPWDLAATTGADNTTGAAWSVTFAADPGIAAGDLLLVGNCLPTDTNPTYGSDTVAATGATLGAQANNATLSIAAGVDAGGRNFVVPCSAGSSSAAPTWTATLSGTTTNASGPAILARFREQDTTVTVQGDPATEESTGVAGAGRKTTAGGIAAETDTALAGAPLWSATSAAAAETATALAGAGRKTAAGAVAAELATAPAGAGWRTAPGAVAAEESAGVAGAGVKTGTGTAGQLDTAPAGAGLKLAAGTPAGETSAAAAGTGLKLAAAAAAAELDTAVAGAGRATMAGAVAAEVDQGIAGAGVKRAAGDPAAEADRAVPGTVPGLDTVQGTPAREAATAVTGVGLKLAGGWVAELVDEALAGAGLKRAAGAAAAAVDTAIGAGLAMFPVSPAYAEAGTTTTAVYAGTTTAATAGGTTTAGVRIR